MAYNNRTYVCIDTLSLSAVTFSQVLESSINFVRKNNDESYTILKYVGQEPSSLTGITKTIYDGREYHNHQQVLEMMAITGATGWSTNELI